MKDMNVGIYKFRFLLIFLKFLLLIAPMTRTNALAHHSIASRDEA